MAGQGRSQRQQDLGQEIRRRKQRRSPRRGDRPGRRLPHPGHYQFLRRRRHDPDLTRPKRLLGDQARCRRQQDLGQKVRRVPRRNGGLPRGSIRRGLSHVRQFQFAGRGRQERRPAWTARLLGGQDRRQRQQGLGQNLRRDERGLRIFRARHRRRRVPAARVFLLGGRR